MHVEGERTTAKKKGAKAKKKKKNTDEDTETVEEDNSVYPKVEIHSWAKIPSTVDATYDNYIVIADEAHCKCRVSCSVVVSL